MTILENYLPELPVDSETPSSSQWEWSNQDMRNYALAAIAAYREKLMAQEPLGYACVDDLIVAKVTSHCNVELLDEPQNENQIPVYTAPMPQDRKQKIIDELTVHLNFKVHVDWVIE